MTRPPEALAHDGMTPLERELADAVDPARFLIRALRARRVGQAG